MKPIKSFSVFLFFSILLLPVAYAFPGWGNINAIYYNTAEDDPTNKFLQQATNELKTNLENVSLKTFTIDNTTKPPVGIFLINDSSHPKLTGKNDESFWLYTNSSGIYIIGKTPIAVRHGAYTLLEKLGFRWFFSYPAWYVTPSSLNAVELNEVQEPYFIDRGLRSAAGELIGATNGGANEANWLKRNRMIGSTDYESRESWGGFAEKNSVKAEDPTAVCYKSDGITPQQVLPDHTVVINRALNYARNYFSTATAGNYITREALTKMSVPISPPDGNMIWCDEWRVNGSYSSQVITDKVFGLTNEVAKMLQTEYPGKYASVLSYSWYPVCPSFALERNVFVEITTFTRGTPLSLQDRINCFKNTPALKGIYDYFDVWQWWRDRIHPPGKMQGFIDAIKIYGDSQNNIKSFYAEANENWGGTGKLLWLTTKLTWDPSQDTNVLLDDFYAKAFGPAKEPMKRYYTRFDTQQPTDRVWGLAFRDIDEALSLTTGDAKIQDRIRWVFYHTYFWWKWGDEIKAGYKFSNVEDAKDLYRFLWRIRDLQIVTVRFQEESVRSVLQSTYGLADEELRSLSGISGNTCPFNSEYEPCTTRYPSVPPTPAEARAWLDEALANWAGQDLIDASLIDVSSLNLVPANSNLPPIQDTFYQTTYTRYNGNSGWKTASIIVPSSGNEIIPISLWITNGGPGPITVKWNNPNGQTIAEKTISFTNCGGYSFPTGCTWEVPTNEPGIYTLIVNGHNYWAVNLSRGAAHDVSKGAIGYSLDGYFFVPQNTPSFVISSGASTAGNYNMNLTAPDGKTYVFSNTNSRTLDAAMRNPLPGFWRITGNIDTYTGASFNIFGIPPLLWHDPQYLLVPANTVLKLILGQYRQAMKPIVDGGNITIEIPIIFYDKTSTNFTISKPLWNTTSNFRFNESGTVSSINTTYITFTVDPNKSVSLLFDIPPPRKTNETFTSNETFYRKEITISSNNSLSNVSATIDINTTYTSYKLYELQGSTWIDVTSNYNLTISNNKATFSGFSTSEKQFRIEGVQPIEQPPEQPSQPPAQPQPTPSGGGGGPVTSISTPITSPITKEPETIKPTEVKQETGAVSLELSTPSTVESGELFNVTVKLLSPIKKTYTLTISDIKQNVELEAGKEKLLTIPIRAMEARGSFSLTSSIDGTTKSKIINLDYKPLFLYVNESKAGNETLITVTVKNYQPLSTELRIIKDGRQDVFIELIEGQKEYQRQLKLTQPGEYKIIATASSEGKTIDIDQYLLSVEGKKSSNYGLILIVAFSFAVIMIMITFLVRQPKIS